MSGWTVIYGTSGGDWITLVFYADLGALLGILVCQALRLRQFRAPKKPRR